MYGTQETPTWIWLAILMLTGLTMWMIEKAHRVAGYFYVGTNLVARMSKKQNSISLSTAEAEYIVVGNCCTQLLWMQKLLADYGLDQGTMISYCDNKSTINISKNHVQHFWTKHINLLYNFIRDFVENKIVALEFVFTDNQLADLFTKPLDRLWFQSLRQSIGVCDLS